jgi:hypothetical protein
MALDDILVDISLNSFSYKKVVPGGAQGDGPTIGKKVRATCCQCIGTQLQCKTHIHIPYIVSKISL